MMIGRTEERHTLNVNEAVRGRAVSEQQKAVQTGNEDGGFGVAYQVDIREKAQRSMTVFHMGSTVQISLQQGEESWTRDEELAALRMTVERYQKLNDNYARLGTPFDPAEEWQLQHEREEKLLGNLSQGSLAPAGQPAEQGIFLKPQDYGQILKSASGGENFPVARPVYTPVTEIQSPHYRWTEETGIEETQTREEEIASWRTVVRQRLEEDVVQAVENILAPRETYEQAYDELYADKGLAVWTYLDTENMRFTQTFKNVQGAFGALGSYLNNFQEEVGTDDPFYDTMVSALKELDPQGENELVSQIIRMVRTTQSGQKIETASDEFEKQVTEAIAKTYGVEIQKPKDGYVKKTAKETPAEPQGLSFLDMQRRAAKEEGRLLDELLGRETEKDKRETAGEVLSRRQMEGKDAEFTDKLRHVEERTEPRKPFVFGSAEQSGTWIEDEKREKQKELYEAWQSMGERLKQAFATETEAYYEKALAIEQAKAAGVDILA